MPVRIRCLVAQNYVSFNGIAPIRSLEMRSMIYANGADQKDDWCSKIRTPKDDFYNY